MLYWGYWIGPLAAVISGSMAASGIPSRSRSDRDGWLLRLIQHLREPLSGLLGYGMPADGAHPELGQRDPVHSHARSSSSRPLEVHLSSALGFFRQTLLEGNPRSDPASPPPYPATVPFSLLLNF